MAYTDLTSAWVYKGPISTANLSAHAQNDLFLKTFLSAYRRPALTWIDATHVDIEPNLGASNATVIVFPDGEIRAVAEDTTTGSPKYRRLNVGVLANFTSGTEASGYYNVSYLSTTAFWSVYVVKSQINSANFVLVADRLPPLQANVATLNSQYGANSWLYLGSLSFPGASIDEFRQTGNFFQLKNSKTVGLSGAVVPGVVLGHSSGSSFSTPVGWTPGATFNSQPPMAVLWWAGIFGQSSVGSPIYLLLQDIAAGRTYSQYPMANLNAVGAAIVGPLPGEQMRLFLAGAGTLDTISVQIVAWTENILTGGLNPYL